MRRTTRRCAWTIEAAGPRVNLSGLGLVVSEVANQLDQNIVNQREPAQLAVPVLTHQGGRGDEAPSAAPTVTPAAVVARLAAAILSDTQLSDASVPPAAQPTREDLMQLVRDKQAKGHEQGFLLGPGRSQEDLEHGTACVVWAADISVDLADAMLLHRAAKQAALQPVQQLLVPQHSRGGALRGPAASAGCPAICPQPPAELHTRAHSPEPQHPPGCHSPSSGGPCSAGCTQPRGSAATGDAHPPTASLAEEGRPGTRQRQQCERGCRRLRRRGGGGAMLRVRPSLRPSLPPPLRCQAAVAMRTGAQAAAAAVVALGARLPQYETRPRSAEVVVTQRRHAEAGSGQALS